MAFTSLSVMAKVALGTGVITSTIMVSGIAWQGTDSVTKIQSNLNNMKTEVVEAVADNTFLKGQFDSLKGLYAASVQEANGKISGLLQERNDLTSQVNSLKGELAEAGDLSEEQAVLQAEISRLEGELDKANQQIADLEAYAASTDAETTYTAMTTTETTSYTATEQDIVDIPLPITGEALTLNQAKAELLASPETVVFFENELASTLPPAALVGVTTYTKGTTTYLAYEVAEPFKVTQASLTYEMQQFLTNNGFSYVYFVTKDGAFVANASQWGSVTVEKTPLQ